MATKKPRPDDDDSPIAQAKILRVFKLIALLKGGHFTIAQLAARLDMNRRSIYRYLKLLEAIDFNVGMIVNAFPMGSRWNGPAGFDRYSLVTTRQVMLSWAGGLNCVTG